MDILDLTTITESSKPDFWDWAHCVFASILFPAGKLCGIAVALEAVGRPAQPPQASRLAEEAMLLT